MASFVMPTLYPIFSFRVGMRAMRLVLPQRSPSPPIVPWTCLTPFLTAAMELAMALPVSLWQ